MSDKSKGIFLAVLLAVLGLVVYLYRQSPLVTANNSSVSDYSYKPLSVENPALQREKLEASRRTEYKSSGRDLFSEIPPPPPEPVKSAASIAAQQAAAANIPPPPPPPPTLPPNIKFFGYGTVPNGTARRAFLTDGEEIYIVGEGDTLLGKFRIVRIGNANLDFMEIATGRQNSVTLEEQAAPS
ncbi:MAG TPA: hypothetical protein VGI16_12185 [Candidatus Acidoferrum sp.]|jgi:hypothetical protein